MQQLCKKANGAAKVVYRTRAAAEKKRRQGREPLWVYRCPHCDGFHLTSHPPRFKTQEPPSLKTLRGRLENAAREIRAADRRLAKIEQKKADAEFRAAHILKQMELETELEQQAISEMVGRLQWK